MTKTKMKQIAKSRRIPLDTLFVVEAAIYYKGEPVRYYNTTGCISGELVNNLKPANEMINSTFKGLKLEKQKCASGCNKVVGITQREKGNSCGCTY